MKKLGSACMEYKMNNTSCMDTSGSEEDDHQMNMIRMIDDVRRGPWTVEEDFALINYIAHHGEGRWNSLARSAGLQRTGKSCRLRWLNYLCPDVRRGNITLEEQLVILELHSRWGNRWSKIAQHLPGRTDNEIKNYWRTRVQKHAKRLKCDINSKQFKDTMRYLWMPRLAERIDQAASTTTTTTNTDLINPLNRNSMNNSIDTTTSQFVMPNSYSSYYDNNNQINSSYIQDCFYPIDESDNQHLFQANNQISDGFDGSFISPSDYFNGEMDFDGIMNENNSQLWNIEDVLFLEQQFNNIDEIDNSKT